MLTLITGGSGSGKSAYAEKYVLQLGENRIYIATMRPYGEGAKERIRRHREARKDKGFSTVECYRSLAEADLPENANVLLEDLGNLAANILFDGSGEECPDANAASELSGGSAPDKDRESALSAAKEIANDVAALYSRCSHLTVVSNDVFSSGKDYDSATLYYMQVLAFTERMIAGAADLVAEVYFGIPGILKQNDILCKQTGKVK